MIVACARLAGGLLLQCPNLVILATSRESLRIVGEVVYRLPGMSFPLEVPNHIADLLGYEAVELFVERARAVQPNFVLTSRDAAAVTEICRRLDGIPLAIELAAARALLLRPAEIARRLCDRFALLTEGRRATPPRHQSLRASIGWSYELLPAAEQALFRLLAIFAGSFSLEAAEMVCAGRGSWEHLGSGEVLDLLTRLVDKSLVQADPSNNETCFQLLESQRDYARERLIEAGEAVQLGQVFLTWSGEPNAPVAAVPVRSPEPSIIPSGSPARWPTFGRRSTGELMRTQPTGRMSPAILPGSALPATASREATG
jgi:predicted ATPase